MLCEFNWFSQILQPLTTIRVSLWFPCCPRKDVLDWLIPRRLPIEALSIHAVPESHDLDASDINFITQLAETERAVLFWAMVMAIQPLVDFGAHVVNWLHGCTCGCPTKKYICPLKGRRAVELALGKMEDFMRELKKLPLTQPALVEHDQLAKQSNNTGSDLLSQFNTAKAVCKKQPRSLWACLFLRVPPFCGSKRKPRGKTTKPPFEKGRAFLIWGHSRSKSLLPSTRAHLLGGVCCE